MPRVVLDLRKWEDYGIGTYLKALTTGLHELQAPGFEFHALHPDASASLPFPIQPFGAGDYSMKGFLRLGGAARKAGADLLHIPHFTLPWRPPPTVLTVHDLIHLRFPEAFGRLKTTFLGEYLRRALVRAERIIAVSRATQADLIGFLPSLGPKIRVIANATLPEFYTDRANDRRDYYLFIGNAKPHKGIPILLEAWARFHAAHPDRRLVMVTPGEFAGPGLEIRPAVPRDAMPDLIASARALLAPSGWEGFDLPVLEAVLMRTPVVASDIPAHLELLGGDHPLLFPAGNALALRMRLEETHCCEQSASRLESLRERHRVHDPRAMAEATLGVYREALNGAAHIGG